MKLFKRIAAVIMAATIVATCFVGCKRQEAPEPDPVLTDSQFKELASKTGADFFEAFRVRNATNMATLSYEDLRTKFIDDIENYYEYVQNSVWIEEFYNMYLHDVQVVESTFNRVDDTHGEIDYKIIIANYNSEQNGALVSYNVTLQFVVNAKTETVYVTNPELSIQLYEDMVDDYARYLLDKNYASLTETTPAPTATPTPVPPAPSETQPQETNQSAENPG